MVWKLRFTGKLPTPGVLTVQCLMLSKPKHPHCTFPLKGTANIVKNSELERNFKKFAKKFVINVASLRIMRIFAVRFERNQVLTREHSSVGLEHLPYKQRVGGSTPSAPTKSLSSFLERLFSICHSLVLFPAQLKIWLPDSLGFNWKWINVKSRLFCNLLLPAQSRRSKPFGRSLLAYLQAAVSCTTQKSKRVWK